MRTAEPHVSKRWGSRGQASVTRRCELTCCRPVSETVMHPPPDPGSRLMKPRSVASSQTGSRGQEVRQASITSAYARGFGPIHSRRSKMRLSTVSSTSATTIRSALGGRGPADPAQRRQRHREVWDGGPSKALVSFLGFRAPAYGRGSSGASTVAAR